MTTESIERVVVNIVGKRSGVHVTTLTEVRVECKKQRTSR